MYRLWRTVWIVHVELDAASVLSFALLQHLCHICVHARSCQERPSSLCWVQSQPGLTRLVWVEGGYAVDPAAGWERALRVQTSQNVQQLKNRSAQLFKSPGLRDCGFWCWRGCAGSTCAAPHRR